MHTDLSGSEIDLNDIFNIRKHSCFLFRVRGNAMDGIGDELKRHQKVLRELEERERDIRYELAKFDSYAEQIEELKKQLAKIDEKLGVNQDE